MPGAPDKDGKTVMFKAIQEQITIDEVFNVPFKDRDLYHVLIPKAENLPLK